MATSTKKTTSRKAAPKNVAAKAARQQGPQGKDPKVMARVVSLAKEGKSNAVIAEQLGMHVFQVQVARALGGEMKPGAMVTYFKQWAAKH